MSPEDAHLLIDLQRQFIDAGYPYAIARASILAKNIGRAAVWKNGHVELNLPQWLQDALATLQQLQRIAEDQVVVNARRQHPHLWQAGEGLVQD